MCSNVYAVSQLKHTVKPSGGFPKLEHAYDGASEDTIDAARTSLADIILGNIPSIKGISSAASPKFKTLGNAGFVDNIQ